MSHNHLETTFDFGSESDNGCYSSESYNDTSVCYSDVSPPPAVIPEDSAICSDKSSDESDNTDREKFGKILILKILILTMSYIIYIVFCK